MTSLHAIPFPNISPVFFELGPLQFRWYGLMYLIGLAGAYFLIMHRVESRGLSMTKDQVYNMVVWAAFGVFIGGRLGYTLFYNFSYYIQHPASIVAVWEGGMSFHGGLIGVASRWPDFIEIARTVLEAAGVENDRLVLRNGTRPRWTRGLDQTAAIICDACTARTIVKLEHSRTMVLTKPSFQSSKWLPAT